MTQKQSRERWPCLFLFVDGTSRTITLNMSREHSSFVLVETRQFIREDRREERGEKTLYHIFQLIRIIVVMRDVMFV